MKNTQPLLVGCKFPNFNKNSTKGEIDFYNWAKDSWVLLFFHPGQSTPVCTTEIATAAYMQTIFKELNCKTLSVTLHSISELKSWINEIKEVLQFEVNFPLICDIDLQLSNSCQVIHKNFDKNSVIRQAYLIDPQKIIQCSYTHPNNIGRNFVQIVKQLDNLQVIQKYKPINQLKWIDGQPILVNQENVDDEDDRFQFDLTKLYSFEKLIQQHTRNQ